MTFNYDNLLVLESGEPLVLESGEQIGLEPTIIGYSPSDRNSRVIVRTSTGILYVVLHDFDHIQIWKSNDNGQNWSQQDEANSPHQSIYTHPSIAIDSADVIHVVYVSTFVYQIRYATFHTDDAALNKDTWQIDEQIDDRSGDTLSPGRTSITVDSNDIPHVVFLAEGSFPDRYIFYTNRIGGTWKAEITAIDTVDMDAKYPQITVDDSDIPIVIGVSDDLSTNPNPEMHLGNQNDATSFSGISNTDHADGATGISYATDSSGNFHVVHTVTSGIDKGLYIQTHLSADNWSTWQSAVKISDATYESMSVSMAANGTDLYVVVVDSNGDIILWKNLGGGWESETIEKKGLNGFRYSSLKWSKLNNNEDSVRLDYVFFDVNNAKYNNYGFPVQVKQSTIIKNDIIQSINSGLIAKLSIIESIRNSSIIKQSITQPVNMQLVLKNEILTAVKKSTIFKNDVIQAVRNSTIFKNDVIQAVRNNIIFVQSVLTSVSKQSVYKNDIIQHVRKSTIFKNDIIQHVRKSTIFKNDIIQHVRKSTIFKNHTLFTVSKHTVFKNDITSTVRKSVVYRLFVTGSIFRKIGRAKAALRSTQRISSTLSSNIAGKTTLGKVTLSAKAGQKIGSGWEE